MTLSFNEETIIRLFGNEAAENESLDRLRQYYVKSAVHAQVIADIPLRVLVGHKGIGKSALVKVALAEDRERGHLALLVRPDDIASIASEQKSFLELIRDWKLGLTELLAHKVTSELGCESSSPERTATGLADRFIAFITESARAASEHPNLPTDRRNAIHRFLTSGKIIVYIDDLDRGWEGRPFDIKRISALLNAVRDLSSDNYGLQFRIALRSDVYFLVRTSDESTDKIESSVIWYSWTSHEIFVLLLKRIETFFGRTVDENYLLKVKQASVAHLLHPVFEARFTGRGHWENAPIHRVLMSLIRKRPRDLVKICTAAARYAHMDHATRIGTKHLEAIFHDYSQGRIQDAINEYRTELPDVERLVMGMKPAKRERSTREAYCYTKDQLFRKLANIQETGSFTFATGRRADTADLAQFLYKINFLVARKEMPSGEVIWKFFEENRYLSNRFADFGYSWEVHPAYRWALQPDSVGQILTSIRLMAEE